MKFRYPAYYEQFSCIADRCEDTCCAGWEIDIDDESYAYYMNVEGAFGEELRRQIKEYESVCHRQTSRIKCMFSECTQNLSRKKISYKFTQFLQGISIFISVKFTLTDG